MNLFVSYMRFGVPFGVALVLTATGWLGIPVDSEAAAGVVSLGLMGAYYAVVRGLEHLAERMGWRPLQLAAGVLLGWAQPPAYEKDVTVPRRVTIDLRPRDEEMRALLADLMRRPNGGQERPR